MRILIAAGLAVSLSATSLLAADLTAPLAPGGAAGVKKAQDGDNTMWLVVGGVAAVAILAAAAAGSGNVTPTTTS